MVANGVRCLITLGGDGTNRIVAKASGDVPLMPISTGTNNVFPVMIEGTIAGLAAGLAAAVAEVAATYPFAAVRAAMEPSQAALIDLLEAETPSK